MCRRRLPDLYENEVKQRVRFISSRRQEQGHRVAYSSDNGNKQQDENPYLGCAFSAPRNGGFSTAIDWISVRMQLLRWGQCASWTIRHGTLCGSTTILSATMTESLQVVHHQWVGDRDIERLVRLRHVETGQGRYHSREKKVSLRLEVAYRLVWLRTSAAPIMIR